MNDNDYIAKLIETLRSRVTALVLSNIELEAALLASQAENQRLTTPETNIDESKKE